MATSISQTEHSGCGCCEGISAETPVRILNRPGLSAIAYRVGTHAEFKDTLRARLSASGQAALSGLTSRDHDDFAIALLDAWATVGDVLTFYQERIANEAYLRTATERLSVLELARLINYELRPGVAATTYLAFTIEDVPGAAGQALAVGTLAQIAPEPLPPVTIGAGSQVQSIPGPGEKAQTFETVEEIAARPAWNSIRPLLTQPQRVAGFLQRSIVFQGATTGIKKGDLFQVSIPNSPDLLRTAINVTINDQAQTTRVDFELRPSAFPPYTGPSGLIKGQVGEFASRADLTSQVKRRITTATWDERDLSAVLSMQKWEANALAANIRTEHADQNSAAGVQVFVYRQKAAIFGYNAPKKPTYKGSVLQDPELWSEWTFDHENPDQIYLDRVYEEITPGSFITVEKGATKRTFQVTSVTTVPHTAYGLSSRTTLLTLAQPWRAMNVVPPSLSLTRRGARANLNVSAGLVTGNSVPINPLMLGEFRDVTVHVQSESLPLAELPIETPLLPREVTAKGLTLDGPYLGLRAGQRIVLKGERDDLRGVYGSEALTLKAVTVAAGFTVLTFNESLTYPYVRDTVNINANVATATHGETVQETLGGGDATQAFQHFVLRQPPLTYVSASSPSGAQSTLEVRVNDILWSEVSDFFGHGPDERIYTTKHDDQNNTTLIFGDGITGARLPTGQENIKAKYRKGIGLPGLVRADQLTQLITRPLGVKGATNPLASAGAADPEQLEDARRNASLNVLTLGRIVSLQDYEDFARSFSGIDKALATWTWFGNRRGVFVTVAGPNGSEVSEDSQLYQNVIAAMRNSGNPLVPLQVASYQPGLFRLAAALKIESTNLPEKVLAQVEQKLRKAFSFAARSFGQPVHLSEVIAVMQNVAGVIAANVTGLYRSAQTPDLEQHLAAAVPGPTRSRVSPAELLTLDPGPVELRTFQ